MWWVVDQNYLSRSWRTYLNLLIWEKMTSSTWMNGCKCSRMTKVNRILKILIKIVISRKVIVIVNILLNLTLRNWMFIWAPLLPIDSSSARLLKSKFYLTKAQTMLELKVARIMTWSWKSLVILISYSQQGKNRKYLLEYFKNIETLQRKTIDYDIVKSAIEDLLRNAGF